MPPLEAHCHVNYMHASSVEVADQDLSAEIKVAFIIVMCSIASPPGPWKLCKMGESLVFLLM